MKIYLASDHAGFELKSALLQFVSGLGYDVEDVGPYEYDEQDDYPDFIVPLARAVGSDEDSFGIVIGGSGQGEAMAANRTPGVRAAVFYGGSRGVNIVRLSREHNNANVLSIGARFVSADEAKEAVSLWLSTPFSGDARHVRRLGKF
ncbi:MAG TPA: RpiB/LacA/LacB family sugar-phosphate isomerase [Candidatus Paceibacterota bacterium]